MLHRDRTPHLSWFYLLVSVALAGFAAPATAQIVPDATLGNGNNSTILINGIRTDINGGLRRNSALFHSFEQFGILPNHQVYFANPAGIRNIFSRVTGGNISNIDGLLGVSGGANLFFMNPNGIIFGSNARLDISGSFLATTANVLQFADGQKFAATGDRVVPLVEVNIPIGLQFGANPPAMLTNRGNLAAGKDLTLAAGNLDLQGQLQAGENLTLNATDTVKIRDTVTEPFVARSGGDMTIQGNQSIDILALNYPTSGLISGADMVLRSANTVGGDAHYWAGGNFRIEQLDGIPGSLFSPHDPIIRTSGDVTFDSYTGTSLYIFAGGSVTVTGNIDINGPDLAFSTIPTLEIHAGTTAVVPEVPVPNPIPGIMGLKPLSPPNTNSPPSGAADITITGRIENTTGEAKGEGQVLLTNQLTNQSSPNALPGKIKTGLINVYGDVTIDSRGDIQTTGKIDTTIANDNNAGKINLIANGNITPVGQLRSEVTGGSGKGGDIFLFSRNGEIDTTQSPILAKAPNNLAGKITLVAKGDIHSGSINASSNISNVGVNQPKSTLFNDIRINSEGSVFVENKEINATNSGFDPTGKTVALGGDVIINASGKVRIANKSSIQSQGDYGRILIGSALGVRESNVGSINTVQSIEIDNSSLKTDSGLQNKSQPNAGAIMLNAKNVISILGGSQITSTATYQGTQKNENSNRGRIADITVTGGAVNITNSLIDASTSGTTQGGDIIVAAQDGGTITLLGDLNPVTSAIKTTATGIGYSGKIILSGGTITSTGYSVNASSSGAGNAGSITFDKLDNNITLPDKITVLTPTEVDAINLTNSSLTTSAIGTTANEPSNSGDIRIEANQSITTVGGSIKTSAGSSGAVPNTNSNGKAGSVSISSGGLNANAIKVTNTGIDAAAFGSGGTTGAVQILAKNGGDIDLIGSGTQIFTDTYGSKPTGGISVISGNPITGVRGGNITIDNYTLDATVQKGTGKGGNVTVQTNGGTIDLKNGGIATTVINGASGSGGDIKIESNGGQIALSNEFKVNSATKTVAALGKGGDVEVNSNGGQIIVDGNSAINASTSGTQTGGKVSVFSGNNTIQLNSGKISTTVKTGASADGGLISVQSNGNAISLGSASGLFEINAATEVNSNGQGGNVEIATKGGQISVFNKSTINASTNGSKPGGNVSLASGGGIINLSSGGITTTVGDQAAGNGGEIAITSNNGLITLGSAIANTKFQVNAQTKATNTIGNAQTNGKGGNVTISSGTGDIALVANSSVTAGTTGTKDSGEVTVKGANIGLTGSGTEGSQIQANSTGSGNAGKVTVTGAKIDLTGSQIRADSTGSGGAGDVAVIGTDISLTGSRIQTNSAGSRGAGDVAVTGADINLAGSQIQAKSTGSGSAGKVSVAGADIRLVSGVNSLSKNANRSEISTSATEKGAKAGDVTLSAVGHNFTLQNSDVSASSKQGTAGDITINARQVDMKNGNLFAEVGSSVEGKVGNITLNVFRLTLEDESLISTLGLGGANGGNINIDINIDKVRVLSAKPPTGPNGSDIVGRAEGGGQGGKVVLGPNTLVARFVFRKAVPGNRTNDIDTNGQLANFSTDADVVSRGLSTPLIAFTDVSQLSKSACEAVGAKAAVNSELRIAGHGGVTLSPTVTLPAQPTSSDWVSLDVSPQVPTNVTFSNGATVTLKPGQTYQVQATCVKSWKEQQRSLL